jgi:hypothetical protein
MNETHPPTAEDLGHALVLRRMNDLGYPAGHRRRFWRERIRPHLSDKTLMRLENGELHASEPRTVAIIEGAYELKPGSLARYAETGKLEPRKRKAPGAGDPRLEAIAALPAQSPDRPWGFTDSDRREMMAHELAQRDSSPAGESAFRFDDPRLAAIAALPPVSAFAPWGFTEAQREFLMMADLGQLAFAVLRDSHTPAPATEDAPELAALLADLGCDAEEEAAARALWEAGRGKPGLRKVIEQTIRGKREQAAKAARRDAG